jgi:ACS family tartrate transporter-like MFS transporter
MKAQMSDVGQRTRRRIALRLLPFVFAGWHSDKAGERRWHTAVPLACAGIAYLLLLATRHHFPLAMALFVLGGGFLFSCYPVFWSMPTMILSESAAAASFGLINSLGQLGGLVGPYTIGYLNDRTGNLAAALVFIGMCYLLAAGVVPLVKIRNPLTVQESFRTEP